MKTNENYKIAAERVKRANKKYQMLRLKLYVKVIV